MTKGTSVFVEGYIKTYEHNNLQKEKLVLSTVSLLPGSKPQTPQALPDTQPEKMAQDSWEGIF